MRPDNFSMELTSRFTVVVLEDDKEDNFRGTVQWCWWITELPRSLRKNAASCYEVFFNRMDYENEIDLETILKTHKVTICK